MTLTVTVKKNKFDDLQRDGQQIVEGVHRLINERVLEDAKNRVHVISGETRDSGHIEDDGSVVFGYGAVFEEFGTMYRPPHPFLMPAFDAATVDIPDMVREAIEDAAR